MLYDFGIPVSVLKLTRIMPVEEECAIIASGYDKVFFFEEGIRNGGIGELFGSMLIGRRYAGHYENTAIEGFVPPCSPNIGLQRAGLDAESIVNRVSAACSECETNNRWARTV